MASCSRKIEIDGEDDAADNKWSVSLTEEVFKRFMAQGSPVVNKVFGDGSLFSPLLFGKYFDPCDAFPLWEFESDVLLAHLRNSSKTNLDWSESSEAYLLRSELPGNGINTVGIGVTGEKGKIMEIRGRWKQQQQQRESKGKDWRSGNWWENGYVRRIELPLDADSAKIEAFLTNEFLLQVKIPKIVDHNMPKKSD